MSSRFPLPSTPAMTRAERVRLQLAAEIVAGTFRPGTRLDEVVQSNRMGVSRTPLREAVRQLASLGLVENRPHRGVVVAEGVGDALFETLAELESVCAALAAQRMESDARTELVKRAESNGGWLHLVHQGCANAVLVGLLETLWQPLTLSGGQPEGPEAQELSRRAAEAVANGDRAEAQLAMRAFVAEAAKAFNASQPQRKAV